MIAVGATELRACDEDSLHVLWGALAGRVGLSLDWRGTRRCAEFTMKDPLGGSMPLSGGWVLEARRGELILGRRPNERHEVVVLPEQGSVRWGEFRFRVAAADEDAGDWGAELPSSSTARVRGWSSGDRLAATGSTGPRRVKRYLSDARVVGLDRARWPVVELGAEVVWIPGVRRSDAATARSGRPGRHYVCERTLG
jgi:tRNA(Ile)-lysidine synthase